MSRVPDFSLLQGELEVYKASKEANKKKLVRDAFEDGDVYFNYGDVFYLDQDYFVYFHDRIGDTFRFDLFILLVLMLLCFLFVIVDYYWWWWCVHVCVEGRCGGGGAYHTLFSGHI